MFKDPNQKDSGITFLVAPDSLQNQQRIVEENPSYVTDISSFDDNYEDNPSNTSMLSPEHPLLEKFQKALKEHLEKQIEFLNNEVYELESEAKKKAFEREQLGIETYETQQQVNKQQEDLEMCVLELQQVCAATEETEHQLDTSKKCFNKKRQELLEAEKNEIHLRNEVEGLNLLLHQIKQWENEVESELTINQRVLEKTKKDKMKLTEEKRQLDMIIYKLMTEVFRLEEELETMDMQIRVKEEERERLAIAVTNSNVDVETMNSENRCLLHSWNSIVNAIKQRDKHYNTVKSELDFQHEKMRLMMSELDQISKLCKKEMIQNEKLTDIKTRIETDIENCKRLMDIEFKKRDNLETEMNRNQSMLDQVEQDLKRLLTENTSKSYQLELLTKEFEKLCCQKIQLEDQILKTLDEQLTNNKAAKYLNKLAHQVKETNGDLEINLANLENVNAKTLMDIEALKCANEETQRFLDELNKQQNALEKELKDRSTELEKMMFASGIKQRDVDILTTKIENALSKQGGSEFSPEELKIIQLEKNIEDIKEKIKQLQKFWLRQQGHVVSLAHQRQEQINTLNMLKKQMMLLVQKNLKINDELDAFNKQEEAINRSITNLQNRLSIVSEGINKKKECKDTLTKDNDSKHNHYLNQLKEAEIDVIKIESDITDIEEDKLSLSNELIELNREALVWEKKIQMAVETRTNMEEEKGVGGEIGNMKAEIHRMHVRYGQLRKAQEKLITDLEHCISRRDAIMTLAVAREKKEKGGTENMRINYTRKLDDMKNKVKQLENEVVNVETKMDMVNQEEQRLLQEITMTKNDKEQTQQLTEQMENEVELAKTKKFKNLETLVIKQKKLKVYSELAKGRSPYILYKTDCGINAEYDKQKEINNNLQTTIESLLLDFPTHKHALERIFNTLMLPTKIL